MNNETVATEKLSIKDFLAQDVEEQGIEMMNKQRVVMFNLSYWP